MDLPAHTSVADGCTGSSTAMIPKRRRTPEGAAALAVLFFLAPGAESAAQNGHYHPAWSPDGTRIVYTGDDDGDFDLYVVDLEGGTTRQLTFNDVLDVAPSFTPEGDSIVFSSALGPDRDLYVVALDGGTPRPLVELPGNQGRPRFIADHLVSFNDRMGTENRSVAVLDLRSGAVRTVLDSPANDEWATWSRHTDRMLVSTDRDGYWTIYVARWDGSDARPFLDVPADTETDAPDFSPDGRSFVYQSDKGGDFEVYLHDLDRGTEANLSRSPESYDGIPAYSPDGAWVAFESTREGGARRIFIVRTDGTGLRRVSG